MPQKDKVKILITSAGSTNGVNVIKALKEQKELKLFLIACDMNPLAAGFYMADKYFVVPKANNPNFIPTILKICKKERIQIIIPTFSFELPFFAKNKAIIEKEGIKMAISDYETFLITEDKLRTYEYFKKWEIPFPKVYTENEIKEKKVKFPVIIRPINASGSKDVVKVNNWEELYFFKKYIKNNFVQEFVEGEEYTIDGINDLKGKMITASPRIRLETKGGLAVKSITVNSPQMVKFTKKIVEGFKIKGPFNVQCIKKGKEIKFIEVNSRFPSGGLPLTVKAGLNIPLILVKLLLGKKIKKPKIKPNVVMTRYWDAIIIKKINKKYKIL
jgi:carbamoyl-phosphate synthase large subunit